MWSMQRRLNDCYRQQRFPVPRLRLRRDGRPGRVHGRQRQGCRVDRARHQALKGPRHDPQAQHLSPLAAGLVAWLPWPAVQAPLPAPTGRADAAMHQGVLPRPGHRQGRPPAAGRVHPACSLPTWGKPLADAPPSHRGCQPGHVKWPAGRQVHRRLEGRREASPRTAAA
jgi:hypothetical protein